MALTPDQFDDLCRRFPKLAHVSSPEHVESIKRHGLQPAGTHGNPARDQDFFTPRPGHVYLYEPHQARDSRLYNDAAAAVFLVDTASLDPSRFKADEDFVYSLDWLEALNYDVDTPPADYEAEPGETLGAWAEKAGLDDPAITYDSLMIGFSIAYEGSIPPAVLELDEIRLAPLDQAQEMPAQTLVTPALGQLGL